MSRRNFTDHIGFTSYDQMFGKEDGDREQVASILGEDLETKIVQIPIEKLHTFENHPFHVKDDEAMEELVQSIRERGVIAPGIARKKEDGDYEILSGHRRVHASILAGLETVPMIIRDATDAEAAAIMVDANLQRPEILPSEKAKAYAMKYQLYKHPGIKAEQSTLEILSEDSGENEKTIQRFLQLARLSDDLLALVDEKQLGLGQGRDLSFLNLEAQETVYECILDSRCKMSLVQSAQIKEQYQNGELTEESVREVLTVEKKTARKVVIKSNKLNEYFPSDISAEEIEKIIISLLEERKQKLTAGE